MTRYVLMPAGLANAFVLGVLTPTLTWGFPLLEKENVPIRRAVFIHSYSTEELEAISVVIAQNPQVEVLDALPADWRYSNDF